MLTVQVLDLGTGNSKALPSAGVGVGQRPHGLVDSMQLVRAHGGRLTGLRDQEGRERRAGGRKQVPRGQT